MEQTKEPKTSKGLVTFSHWVALAITALEMTVYLVSFIPAIYCLRSFAGASNLLAQSFFLLSGYFGFQMYLVFVSAGLARCFRVPNAGRYSLHDPRLNTVWMRDALSTLCYRTFVHSFANFFPFPGYLYYRLLGAKLYPDSTIDYSARILSPYMVSLGRKVYIGTSVTISGHSAANIHTYVLGQVKIGHRVMIGAVSTISPDVEIGDDSIVATGSVVIPGTRVPAGELWGGVPAKLIKKLNLEEPFVMAAESRWQKKSETVKNDSIPEEIQSIVKDIKKSEDKKNKK